LDSTSLAFGSTIRNITQGSGVDVILNALSGEMLRQSFELLAPYGRFVEIGKRDIIEDQGLAMGVFNRNAAFIAIDLDRMLKDRPHLVREALLQCFEHIDTGRYRPLPTEVIDVEHISQAFRTMASRDRIGRVSVSYAGAKIQVVDEDSRCAITDTGCYLITGGTSGLGLELARSMAESGAGQVVLASRSGAVSEAATAVVTEMTDAGTEVWAPKTDISEEASVIELIDAIKQKGWILKGVVHCALVLEDGFLKSISEENLENVFGPKVKGAQLLDIHTRELSLDFWIAFSSIATLLGSVGQGCYVAANACLEQMAVARQQAGFPAMTVILGYLADTGVASRNAEVTQHLKRAGLKGMQSKHVSKMLLPLASLKEPVVGFFEIDWNEWSALHPKIAQWTRFQEVLEDDPNRLTNSKLTLVREALMRIAGEKRGGWIKEQLLSLLSEITLIPANKIMPDVAISNLGIDSLMVLELIGRVKRELGVTIVTTQVATPRMISSGMSGELGC
jgi:NAD(P)-dependent dehydrogenase (short-subunit alcohol dehydrogenase family)/acyl carrier protein